MMLITLTDCGDLLEYLRSAGPNPKFVTFFFRISIKFSSVQGARPSRARPRYAVVCSLRLAAANGNNTESFYRIVPCGWSDLGSLSLPAVIKAVCAEDRLLNKVVHHPADADPQAADHEGPKL